MAELEHNTWSWGCKVPTDERPNGDGLDAFAVCLICEPNGELLPEGYDETRLLTKHPEAQQLAETAGWLSRLQPDDQQVRR